MTGVEQSKMTTRARIRYCARLVAIDRVTHDRTRYDIKSVRIPNQKTEACADVCVGNLIGFVRPEARAWLNFGLS
ncbi:head-tail adaptor [Paraburkholderia sp. GAS333]